MRKVNYALLWLFLTLILLSATSCSSGSKAESNEINPRQPIDNVEESTEIPEQQNTDTFPSTLNGRYVLTEIQGYVNDVSWIRFREIDTNGNPVGDGDEGNMYFGLIDANGVLQFYYDYDKSYFTMTAPLPMAYENGYSYVEYNQRVFLIERDGSIADSYPTSLDINGEYQVVSYGGGYQFFERYKTGFDGETFDYYVMDSSNNVISFSSEDGNSLEEFGFGNEEQPSRIYPIYIGKGIFYVAYPEYSDEYGLENSGFLFFCNSQKVAPVIVTPTSWTSASKEAKYAFDLFDPDSNLFILFDSRELYTNAVLGDKDISYATEDGELFTVSLPNEFGSHPVVVGVSDGIIFFTSRIPLVNSFYSYKRQFNSYNTKTGKFTAYSGKYSEQAKDDLNETNYWNYLSFKHSSYGIYAMPLIGKDQGWYVVLVDSQMEELTNPISVTEQYIMMNGVLYDGKGNYREQKEGRLYGFDGNYQFVIPSYNTFTTCGFDMFYTRSSLEDIQEITNGFYHVNGTLAFESIDYKHGKYYEGAFTS